MSQIENFESDFVPIFLTELDTRYIGGGRNKLLQSLIFEYEHTKVIKVEKGFITDFASIPRLARWLITGQDNTKRGAVIHDKLYEDQPEGVTRKFADDMFLKAMLTGPDEMRVKKWKAYVAYSAVRVGGWKSWNKNEREIRNAKNKSAN